jgi:hypothetical protein
MQTIGEQQQYQQDASVMTCCCGSSSKSSSSSSSRIRKRTSLIVTISLGLAGAVALLAAPTAATYIQQSSTTRRQQQQHQRQKTCIHNVPNVSSTSWQSQLQATSVIPPPSSKKNHASSTSWLSQLQATTVDPSPSSAKNHAELPNTYLQSLGITTSISTDAEPGHHNVTEIRGWFCQPLQRRTIPITEGNDDEDNLAAAAAIASTRATAVDEEYLRRKEAWAAKYTSVDALRETFGKSPNRFWGDLNASKTRRLYKTLLPRALLHLHCMFGDRPEALAPLAFQARLAAKMYARERCRWWLRLATNLYDGWRQWKQYGRFNVHGMSYQQLWEKYAAVIVEEARNNAEGLTVEGVTARICLKISGRSCQTNAMVDRWAFSSCESDDKNHEELQADLQHVTERLKADVRRLLLQDQGDALSSSPANIVQEAALSMNPVSQPASTIAPAVALSASSSNNNAVWDSRSNTRKTKRNKTPGNTSWFVPLFVSIDSYLRISITIATLFLGSIVNQV